jgi:hypothetical protein
MQISHPDPRIRPRQIANVMPIDKFHEHYKTIGYERYKCNACHKITWLETDANWGLMLVCSKCGHCCASEDEEGFTPAPILPQPRPRKRKKPCAQPTLF